MSPSSIDLTRRAAKACVSGRAPRDRGFREDTADAALQSLTADDQRRLRSSGSFASTWAVQALSAQARTRLDGTLADMGLLRTPDSRYHRSFVSMVEEFGGARIDGAGEVNDMDVEAMRDPAAFADLVAVLTGELDVPLADGFVPATSLWMVHDDEIVGVLQVRHRLTPFLLEQGGHIGYSVRPSARRRGLAVQALTEALGVADGLGLDRVLVACHESNIGSRTVIERCGGVYEDSRAGLRRYWIDVA